MKKPLDDNTPVGRGLAEVSQFEIEARAMELAAGEGRSTMNAADLELAQKEILGVAKTTDPTHPSLTPRGKV